MEEISSDWIYIAANGSSRVVGKSVRILARSQGSVCAGEGEETTHVLTLAQAHTLTHHRASHNLRFFTSSCI